MKKIRKLFTVFISILIFLLLLLLLFITTSKDMITKENLTSYIKDANVLNMNVDSLLGNDENITFKEKINNLALESQIPEEIVNDIMESEEINELLGDYLSEIIDYMVNDNKPVLSEETVLKITIVANESLNKNLNIMTSEEELKQNISLYTNKITEMIPEKNEIVNENISNKLQAIINFNTIYLYIAVMLLTVLIGLINRSTYRPLKYLGVSLLSAGMIFVILGSMDGIINGFLSSKVTGMDAIISPLITNILTLWFKSGVFVSFIGLILIIIYIMIRRMVIHTKRYS